MTALVWDRIEDRTYETGIQKGVLYSLDEERAAVWNGLVSVSETEAESEVTEALFEGLKYDNRRDPGFYEAAVTAYGFPLSFQSALGHVEPRTGFTLTGQEREPFHFTYQTLINETDYKIHIVYNALVVPAGKNVRSVQKDVAATNLKWKVVAIPPQAAGPYRPSAHLIVDSRKTSPTALGYIEDALYGTNTIDPYLPTQDSMMLMYVEE